jgi:hypothetical protein
MDNARFGVCRKLFLCLALIFTNQPSFSQDMQHTASYYLKKGQEIEEAAVSKIEYDKALILYKKAFALGSAEGAWRVGSVLVGLAKSNQQRKFGFEWVRKAADAGHSEAQRYIANAYMRNDFGTPDYKLAYKYYLKSAAQGDVKSEYQVGFMLSKGLGTRKDFAESAKWHSKAADSGHLQSCRTLSDWYQGGTGVNKNPGRAAYYSNKAKILERKNERVNADMMKD